MDLTQPSGRPEQVSEAAFDAVEFGQRFERQARDLGNALADLATEPTDEAEGRAALALVRMQYLARQAELLSDRVRLMLARIEAV